ncbi:COP9 signalosome complex subunit 7b [Sciurus carolinensis]|uniref:COP9 signalosome complex subunit 7b n=8 Tax=Boreoeutheria TaxID=1437010 RepID=A0AA41N6C2_SCICA|nr:COP9 signalosome complex subunit 7b [Sciurus carolinensis]
MSDAAVDTSSEITTKVNAREGHPGPGGARPFDGLRTETASRLWGGLPRDFARQVKRQRPARPACRSGGRGRREVAQLEWDKRCRQTSCPRATRLLGPRGTRRPGATCSVRADLKEKKEVVEEAENGRDAPANGNANEENGEQEADNEVDEEEEEGGEEEEEEEEGDGVFAATEQLLDSSTTASFNHSSASPQVPLWKSRGKPEYLKASRKRAHGPPFAAKKAKLGEAVTTQRPKGPRVQTRPIWAFPVPTFLYCSGPAGRHKSPGQRMAGEQKPSSNLLEQFILLAKGTSGSALTALISQVLEAPGVYVFGELLELANVQELAEGANAAYLQLLNLFAYGTYPDYIANKESLPELSTAQQNKLKHLTIVSLASRMKCIPYSVLLKDLEMRNLRELEDLIIEAVYTDIIQGKLDQRNQLLEVDFCIGRDIRKKDINNIVKTLHEWCDGCEAVLLGIEQQVLRANQYKENHHRTQQQVEAEVTNIKKTLKATASSSAQEMEQQLAERECPPHAEQRQPTKKMSKVKGLVSSRH